MLCSSPLLCDPPPLPSPPLCPFCLSHLCLSLHLSHLWLSLHPCLFLFLFVSLNSSLCLSPSIYISLFLSFSHTPMAVSDCRISFLARLRFFSSLGAPNHRRPQEVAGLASDQARAVRHEGNCGHSWCTRPDYRTDLSRVVFRCPNSGSLVKAYPDVFAKHYHDSLRYFSRVTT